MSSFSRAIIAIMANAASTKLCELCAGLQLSKLKQDLIGQSTGKTGNAIILHTLSHEEFYECASVCDICSITASCFEKEIDIWGDRTGIPAVEVSIRRSGRLFHLDFTDKSNWHPVDWMIREDDG
jgi:hypothetical protein